MDPFFVQLSLVPITVGVLAAISCALPGNFLILRGQALIGDAISHVVLPGIVVAFLITGTVSTWPMLAGAGAAAALAVVLIETIRRFGRVEAGAAMGVTFTTLFAGGVLLLEQSDTSSVHLDVEHALYGNLESLIWLGGDSLSALFDPVARADLPPELARMALVTLAIVALTWVFWRPLVLSTFDENHAQSLGLPTTVLSIGLVMTAAVAAVAAFDAVGSILVIAMFICPPATARLLTSRLTHQVALSLIVAIASALGGYLIAGYGPLWLGFSASVSAAGMIATLSGLFLLAACLFGPQRR
ncbi:MAG: metal ABC transporter permease [Pseudomonadota bacterium]